MSAHGSLERDDINADVVLAAIDDPGEARDSV